MLYENPSVVGIALFFFFPCSSMMSSIKAQRPLMWAEGELYLGTAGEILQLTPEGAFSFLFLYFFFFFFSLALYFQLDFSDFWAPAAWVECKGHVRCSSENNPFIVFSISKAFKKNYRCVTAPLCVPLCVTGKWTLKAAFPNFSGYSNGGFLVGCRKLLRIYTFLFFLTYFYPIVSKFCVCVCVLYKSCSSILHSRSWSCYSWISQ